MPQLSRLDELHEELGDVDHAGGLVHHHQAAGAHDRAEVLERLVIGGDVQVRLGDAAAGGAADLHGLVRLAVGNAAADVEDDLAQRGAHGHFHQARAAHHAGEGEDLGALARPRCPSAAYHSAPCSRISGRLASVSTLLMTVGLPNRPLTAGNGGRGRGMPRRPSMLWISAVSSPQTNAPAPILMMISRSKPLSRMLSPERPYCAGLDDGLLAAA